MRFQVELSGLKWEKPIAIFDRVEDAIEFGERKFLHNNPRKNSVYVIDILNDDVIKRWGEY